ncbi:MAG TPA: PhzF family phenazine biosynthesis protein [Capillimicrobium sp.]|jgi:PhzF family phenazine biosynthesis protein
MRRFQQVDVFSAEPGLGNPVAVVHDADGLDAEAMQRFARWTNLSETTFLLAPTAPGADYRVRIFCPDRELPFAGHPTLGSCHAWLDGDARDRVVQECGAGLVELRRIDGRLAFAAPPLLRSGEPDEALVAEVAAALGVRRDEIVAAAWLDNGPGWVGVQLASAEAVLAAPVALPASHGDVGLVGLHPPGSPEAIEVRAFFGVAGQAIEDPVTGSLNAALAGWLLERGVLRAPYTARQGTAMGRAGRVHISRDGGSVWVAGATSTVVSGTVAL